MSTPRISAYLRRHRDGARYEAVVVSVFSSVGLVARDGLPILVLSDMNAPILSVPRLAGAISRRQVRFYFAAGGCARRNSCPAVERYAFEHSVPLDGLAFLRRFIRT